MTAFDDAKTNLEAAVAAAKVVLSNQDQPAQLALAFNRLAVLSGAVGEWVKSYTSLQAIMSSNEREFDAAINVPEIKALRLETQLLFERIAEVRRLLIKLAERARTQ